MRAFNERGRSGGAPDLRYASRGVVRICEGAWYDPPNRAKGASARTATSTASPFDEGSSSLAQATAPHGPIANREYIGPVLAPHLRYRPTAGGWD